MIQILWKMNFHLAYWNLIIGMIGILLLCLLIPILRTCATETGFSVIESIELKFAGVALLVSSCTMSLDLLMDCFDKKYSEYTQHAWVARSFYAVTTFMVGLQYALQYDYLHAFIYYESSFWLAMWCQRIVLMSTLLFFVSISDTNPDTKLSTFRNTVIINIVGCVSTLLQVFDNIMNDESMIPVARLSSLALLGLSCIMFSRQSYHLWKSQSSWDPLNYAQFLYVNLFLFQVTLLPLIFTTLIGFSSTNKTENEYIKKVLHIFTYVVVTIIFTVIPGRIARQDALTSKDNIISTKQAYVRYISHELRTPLNTVHMGVQFCIEQISNQTTVLDINKNEFQSSLVEINMACSVALEILNDLLLYDKLQSGLVTLQNDEVNVIDFLTNCLEMFTIHIRAKNIQLQMINTDVDNLNNTDIFNQSTSDSSYNNQSIAHFKKIRANTIKLNNAHETATTYCIENDDKVHIDKSKLGQVIRNIMSNAIKGNNS